MCHSCTILVHGIRTVDWIHDVLFYRLTHRVSKRSSAVWETCLRELYLAPRHKHHDSGQDSNHYSDRNNLRSHSHQTNTPERQTNIQESICEHLCIPTGSSVVGIGDGASVSSLGSSCSPPPPSEEDPPLLDQDYPRSPTAQRRSGIGRMKASLRLPTPHNIITYYLFVKGAISSRSEQTFNRAWNRCPSLR